MPAGLVLAAVPQREDPSDVLLSEPRRAFADLPQGARVGTSSPRRQAQLRAARADLAVLEARGNVDTRIRRLREGRYDAIVLARAGLARLGRLGEIAEIFPEDVMLPAVGQGALAIVTARTTRRPPPPCERSTTRLSHREVLAERSFLAALEAGCRAPVAGRARAEAGGISMREPSPRSTARACCAPRRAAAWRMPRHLAAPSPASCSTSEPPG